MYLMINIVFASNLRTIPLQLIVLCVKQNSFEVDQTRPKVGCLSWYSEVQQPNGCVFFSLTSRSLFTY